MAIAFILLIAFAGKVYTLSTLGSQKCLWSYVDNGSAQEDKDSSEDGKFADKQLTAHFEVSLLTFTSLFYHTVASPVHYNSIAFFASHILTVPTPPPNC